MEVFETSLTLHCHPLPDAGWNGHTDIYLGTQEGDQVVQDRSIRMGELTFSIPIRIKIHPATGEIDFAGPFVHGKRGERFLYLCWGERDSQGHWHGFSRSKIPLIRWDRAAILAAVHQNKPSGFSLNLVDKKGGPACATLPPDAMVLE